MVKMKKPYIIQRFIFSLKTAFKTSSIILILLLALPSIPPNPIPIQPVKAEAQGSLPPYKAGDWILYRYVETLEGPMGSASCEGTLEIYIEEVKGMHVKYRIKQNPSSRDPSCNFSVICVGCKMEIEVSQDLNSPTLAFLVNPNTTGTKVYDSAVGKGTQTYYKGVLVNGRGSMKLSGGYIYTSEITLIDTSIGELRGTSTQARVLLAIAVIVVATSLLVFWVKRRRTPKPPPPPPPPPPS
jgi:hypothetical protein